MTTNTRHGGSVAFFSGVMGGVGTVLAGHPFDTLKVRLQTTAVRFNDFVNPIDCFFKTLTREGIIGLYKGASPSLFTIPIAKSILFGVNGQVRSLCQKHNEKSPTHGYVFSNGLTVQQVALAGAIAGGATSFASCPVDVLKSRLQTKYDQKWISAGENGHRLHPMITEISTVAKQQGIRGIYRAWHVQFIREVPGYALYFTTYEYLRSIMIPKGGSAADLTMLHILIAGGISGLAFWIVFPIDQIKSRMQTQSFEKPVYKGFVDAVQKVTMQEGIQGYFRGIGPALIRAFCANAASLYFYDVTFRLLTR